MRLYGGAGRERTHNGRRARFEDLYVHVLVCGAFHGPPPFDGAMVLHGDGDPSNNTPDNLRWGSGLDNAADRREHRHRDLHREGMRLATGPGAEVDARWGF